MIAFLSPIRKISGLSSLLTVAATLLGAAVTLPVFAQAPAADAAKADQTYSIQRTYKAGDVDKYRLKVNTKMSGTQTGGTDVDIHLNMVMKETTKSVAADGLITVLEEYIKADAEFNGMPIDILTMMPKVTLTKDKTGTIEVAADGPNEMINSQISLMAKQLMQSASAALPTKPVKVGDTWKSEVSVPVADKVTKTSVTMKLVSVEVVNGVKALKLSTVSDSVGGTGDDTKMHSEGSIYINCENGKAIKMNSKGSGTAAGNKISAEMNMDVAGPEDEKTSKKEAAPK